MALSSVKQMEMVYKDLKDKNVRTIVLTGNRGVGKTWMARKLSERAMSERIFDLTLWIFLNTKYDQKTLLNSIGCQLSLLSPSDEWEFEDDYIEEKGKKEVEKEEGKKEVEKEEGKREVEKEKGKKEVEKEINHLKSKIRDALEGKKLLLVLDDEGNQMMESEIWSKLDDLKLDQNCKILITRANNITNPNNITSPLPVVKAIDLEPLSEVECLSFLRDIVGPNVFELPGIQDLAKIFVGRCRKLPAEMIIIAKALGYFGNNLSGRLKLKDAKEEVLLHDGQVVNVIKLLSNGYEPLPSTILIDTCCLDRPFLPARGALHYNELICYWILEGYLHDQFDCLADAFKKGHAVLMELIDCGLVKQLEAGYVSMNGVKFDLDAHDNYGFFKTRHLGLATMLDIDLGRTNQADGVIKTTYAGEESKRISTLLFDADHLNRDVPDDVLECRSELEVLAIFDPTIQQFDLSEMHKLRLLVLRGCDYLQSINLTQKSKASAATPMAGGDTQDFSQLEGSTIPKMVFRDLIVLEISGPSSFTKLPDTLFNSMPKLQSLNLSSLQIDALPSSFYELTELVCLILRKCSCLTELKSLKKLKKLELLDLSGAISFTRFQDKSFSANPELQTLNLSQSKIMHLPLVNSLGKLIHLFLTDCIDLCRLRRIESLSKLQILDISCSRNFREFHDPSFEKLSSLKLINLSQTSVEELPSDIVNPHYLYLKGCSQLKQLQYMESMKDLQVLDLSGSSSLEEIDENFFRDLKCLRELKLSKTKLKSLPSMSSLFNLRSLLMSDCLSLTNLGELKSMEKLEVLDLSASSALTDFQDESFESLHCLQKLDLSGTKITRLPSLSHPSNLRHLLLKGCTSLKVLPSLESLSKLEELNLSGVRSIGETGADFFEHLTYLQILDLSETQIQKLPSLSSLTNLSYLSLRGCAAINEVPGLPMLTKLEVLDLSGTSVKDLPDLGHFCNLRELLLKDCSGFQKFDDLGMLNILKASIAELPYNISRLTLLEQLELPKVGIHEADAESTICTSEDPNRYNWSISSWPEEALSNSDKLGLTFDCGHFLQLLEKKTDLWQSSFKEFHFLVHSTDAKPKFGDKVFYMKKLFVRDTYLVSQSRKRTRSLEMRGFISFPNCLEPVLTHAECVFLIDNPFVRYLSDLSANNIKQMKVCWIQRCCNLENVLHVDDKDDATMPEEKVKGRPGADGKVDAKTGNSLEILWVLDVVSMKSICDGNLEGFGNLKCLHLEHCSELSHVCFSAQQLKNLEVLQIKYCHNLCALFKDESSATLPKLRTLQLWSVPRLKNIGCAVPTLQRLTVGECPLLTQLFSSAPFPGNLEILQIKFCERLEIVFCGSELAIMIELRQLHLWDLPELTSIGAHLPSLQDRRSVRQCRKLLWHDKS